MANDQWQMTNDIVFIDLPRNICILCPLLGEWRKQRMEQGPVV
ncbi:MAG: hypothetical protein ABSH08_02355 [Tepidisphaeraceae bacterium]